MNFLDKNLEALKRKSPGLVRKLEQWEEDTLPVRLIGSGNDIAWQYQGASGHFPKSQTGLNTLDPEQHLVVLYGIGDGSYLEYVCELSDVYHVLVFEPSLTLFHDLLTLRDMTRFIADDKIHFLVGADKKLFLKEIENYFFGNALHYYYAGYFGNLATPGIQKIPNYQPTILEFADYFKKAIHNYTIRIRNEAYEDEFHGFFNAVRNLKEVRQYPNVVQFRGACRGLPGIVVGSGPSLEMSLPHLRNIQNKAIIFSCDSTLKILLQQGIRPHFVGVLERSIQQSNFFTDLKQEDSPILVAPAMIHPDVFKNYLGPKMTVCRNIGFDDWLYPDTERFYLGRFVSHLGLTVLAILGCAEIALVGMDSAYAPVKPGQSYDESVYGKLATEHMKTMANEIFGPYMESKYNFEIPGYDGKPRKTQYYWHRFAETYGEILSLHGIADAKNVMPIDHGIPIAQTERVDPEYLNRFTEKQDVRFHDFQESFQKKQAQDCDHVKIIQDTHTHLKAITQECLDGGLRLSEFFADYDPSLKKSVPLYKPLFVEIEALRFHIMTEHGGIFKKLLMPFVLNYHALMEHDLRKIFTVTKEPDKILGEQVKLYVNWFHNLAVWSERVQRYLKKIGY